MGSFSALMAIGSAWRLIEIDYLTETTSYAESS